MSKGGKSRPRADRDLNRDGRDLKVFEGVARLGNMTHALLAAAL
jgi:hypothetical protein